MPMKAATKLSKFQIKTPEKKMIAKATGNQTPGVNDGTETTNAL